MGNELSRPVTKERPLAFFRRKMGFMTRKDMINRLVNLTILGDEPKLRKFAAKANLSKDELNIYHVKLGAIIGEFCTDIPEIEFRVDSRPPARPARPATYPINKPEPVTSKPASSAGSASSGSSDSSGSSGSETSGSSCSDDPRSEVDTISTGDCEDLASHVSFLSNSPSYRLPSLTDSEYKMLNENSPVMGMFEDLCMYEFGKTIDELYEDVMRDGSPYPGKDVRKKIVEDILRRHSSWNYGDALVSRLGSNEPPRSITTVLEKEATTNGPTTPTGSPDLAVDIDVKSPGRITPTGSPDLAVDIDVKSPGRITPTGSPDLAVDIELTSPGRITPTGSPDLAVDIELTSPGRITPTGSPDLAVDIEVTSLGRITPTGSPDLVVDIELTSPGRITPTGSPGVVVDIDVPFPGRTSPTGVNGTSSQTGLPKLEMEGATARVTPEFADPTRQSGPVVHSPVFAAPRGLTGFGDSELPFYKTQVKPYECLLTKDAEENGIRRLIPGAVSPPKHNAKILTRVGMGLMAKTSPRRGSLKPKQAVSAIIVTQQSVSEHEDEGEEEEAVALKKSAKKGVFRRCFDALRKKTKSVFSANKKKEDNVVKVKPIKVKPATPECVLINVEQKPDGTDADSTSGPTLKRWRHGSPHC